jgi:hypothetical protein
MPEISFTIKMLDKIFIYFLSKYFTTIVRCYFQPENYKNVFETVIFT